ncbi:MAG: Dabb family protein [Desulfovibrionaceae bacterium]|nr:Dabb family protein [Desulfovibrionaceae bacterium]
MVKHIVMWNLKAQAEGADGASNGLKMKGMLEALRGKVPTLRHIEVSVEILNAAPETQVVLYSEFDDAAGLKAYAVHPEHVKCSEFVKKVVSERRVLDWAI